MTSAAPALYADTKLAANTRRLLNNDLMKISCWTMPQSKTCPNCHWCDRIPTDPACCYTVANSKTIIPEILPPLPVQDMGFTKIEKVGRSSIALNYKTALGAVGYTGLAFHKRSHYKLLRWPDQRIVGCLIYNEKRNEIFRFCSTINWEEAN